MKQAVHKQNKICKQGAGHSRSGVHQQCASCRTVRPATSTKAAQLCADCCQCQGVVAGNSPSGPYLREGLEGLLLEGEAWYETSMDDKQIKGRNQ